MERGSRMVSPKATEDQLHPMPSLVTNNLLDIVTAGGRHTAGELQWRKLEEIGRGAFAVVNRAAIIDTRQQTTIFFVAVKSPLAPPRSKGIELEATMLLHEAAVLQRLGDCPDIVRFFGCSYSSPADAAIFLEFVAGGNILDSIRTSGGRPLSEPAVRCYTQCILRGLAHIHRAGYVHCDIKPANILLPSSTQAKIADFGAAKEAGKRSEVLRGTAAFRSPEAAMRGEQEPAMDIWALGCTVIVMLTGESLNKSMSLWGKVRAIWKCGGSVPRLPKRASETAKDFLMRCLVIDARERWTAEMLLRHPFVLADGA